ncbi:NAD(P)-dependent oxidoreductase [Serinicoccus sp. LYQ131]|uniref:NAD(P)-dependent oxidoreductase n=1 Tax=Serinicoccus sp. LYQ131 TaxID=3378797 RepID=UPI003852B2C5
MKLLLPDSLPLDPHLPDHVAAVRYDATAPVPEEHRDAEALVVWGSSRADLAEAAPHMEQLLWVQSLGAGADSVLAAGFRPSVRIATGAGLHDGPVAEHALTLTLALVRRLASTAQAQQERRWAPELGGVQPLRPDRGPVTSLLGSNVVIWGFGHIGQRLAGLLQGLGATVRGAARSPGVRGGVVVVGPEDLDDELGRTDILIMILPSSPSTDRALDGPRLARLPEHAYLVNVGRGSTVDEEALVEALAAGRLAGAALDVASVEPLPSSAALWEAPNLWITPHSAGGRPVGAEELIESNLAAVLQDRPLRNAVPATRAT